MDQPQRPADAAQRIYNSIVVDARMKPVRNPPNLGEYLRSVGYTAALRTPTVVPNYPLNSTNRDILKRDLVGAILVHLAKNYAGFVFPKPGGKTTRSEDEIYAILENFFADLSRALKPAPLTEAEAKAGIFKENVSLAALVQLSMRTKYSPKHGRVFDIYDPVDPKLEQGMQGNVFNMVELKDFNNKWLDGAWARAYATNVYKHPEVQRLIQAALASGNFALLKSKAVELPEISMQLISLPHSGVSGFAGPDTLYLGVEEFVEKAERFAIDPSLGRPDEATIKTFIKMQLIATVIHEASHVVLRHNYNRNINISSPLLAATGTAETTESGYLSETVFSQVYCQGQPDHLFKWDFMIIGTSAWGPYRGDPKDGSDPIPEFQTWVDDIVKVFDVGAKMRELPKCLHNFSGMPSGFTDVFCTQPFAPPQDHKFLI